MKTLQMTLSNKKNNFIPYIMAGDHEKGLEGLKETIQLLEQAGSSAIEIGVPFSDPVADGPVIEQAGLRELPFLFVYQFSMYHFQVFLKP